MSLFADSAHTLSAMAQQNVSRRRFLQTAGAALSGVALSSCGWTLAEVRPGLARQGNKEQLYIYSWASYIDDELTREFTAQTGIQVQTDIYSSNEQMLATFQAGKGNIYSVLYPSDYTVAKMIELNLLAELDQARIEGLDNLPPQFQDSIHDPGNRHSVPISWGTTGLIYNSEKLSPAPDDWNYLWTYRQKLARRMTMLDDVREVMGATLKSLGYSYNATDPQQIKRAYEKLTELKPAIANFTSDAWRDQLLAGDLLLAMGYSSDAVAVMNEDPKLKYVIPQSGTSLWSDTMVIPRTAPNVDAAYSWINYMMQPSVAAQVTQRLFFATANQAAHDQLPAPLRNNPSLFPSDDLLRNAERLGPVDQTTAEIYDRYWTRLTST